MTDHSLPEEINKQYNKAVMAIDKKNYGYAIDILTHIVNIKPDFVDAWQILRMAQIKNFEKNPPNFTRLAIIKTISFISSITALIEETKGNLHGAMVIYEKILKKDPKNAGILAKLGRLLKIEGVNKVAAVMLENAVTISPKNAAAYELLGEVYSSLAIYDRARDCFKRVLGLKPHDANAERNLKNIDALTTIDRSFKSKDDGNLRIREIGE